MSAVAATRQCRDCRAAGRTGKPLAAPYPGPRCLAHHRVLRRTRRAAAHEAHVGRVYGLPAGDFDALCAFQGGVCAICARARCGGVSGKHLAVDHDHLTGQVRMLVCVSCNRFLLGRYDVQALRRAVQALLDPPYARMLRARKATPESLA